METSIGEAEACRWREKAQGGIANRDTGGYFACFPGPSRQELLPPTLGIYLPSAL